ncbi:MAG: class I SAM-dependent methyltransferase [Spirochaetales bacterium]
MVRVERLVSRLEAGVGVMDSTFDALYPHDLYDLSRTHWTPVQVALEATRMLVTDPGFRVLDVGSGCGKFCLIGALASQGEFTGIELRPRLHEEALRVKGVLGATRAEFFCGEMQQLDWTTFDGFYFYNPFYEALLEDTPREKQIIDREIPLGSGRYFDLTRMVRRKLDELKPGTRVVSYHGVGVPLPLGWHREERRAIGSGDLELWIRR